MTDLEAAVQLLGGETNKVIYDDIGLPSIMVRFDKKMISELVDDYVTDVVHPAFVVNNTELDNFYVSKYENIIINDRAYSLPLQESRITMISKAKEFCTNKGKGWHLFSVAEKAFIALQSFKTFGCIAYDTPTFLIVINEFTLSNYVDSTIVRLP